MRKYKQKSTLRLGLAEASAIAAICMITLALGGAFADWLMLLMLVTAAATVGFTMGRTHKRRSNITIDAPIKQKHPVEPKQEQRDNTNKTQTGEKNKDYMRDIIQELNLMQSSGNLIERYQSFEILVENVLNHVIGRCSISLWCPEEDYQNLIECVIKTSNTPDGRASTFSPDRGCQHRPSRVPLDLDVMRQSLKSGKPYLAENPKAKSKPSANNTGFSLTCHACIPLYREYGQPLIINVERTETRPDKWSADDKSASEDFYTAVSLINLFWKQLQAANQREWVAQHDQSTGVLRDEEFLRRAQQWADRLVRKDELFAVVVITVGGFRGMFAGKSRQWRNLAGTIGHCLNKILIDQHGELLLGKMADDVFALILPWKDKFLAQAAMNPIISTLQQELAHDKKLLMEQDVMAVDLQWMVTDHKQYKANIEQLLNQVYSDLFSHNQPDQREYFRIVLGDPVVQEA